MRNFRELEVWKDVRKLVKEVFLLSKSLPESEKYGLISQINRCAVSIPANIKNIQVLQKRIASLIKYNNSKD